MAPLVSAPMSCSHVFVSNDHRRSSLEIPLLAACNGTREHPPLLNSLGP